MPFTPPLLRRSPLLLSLLVIVAFGVALSACKADDADDGPSFGGPGSGQEEPTREATPPGGGGQGGGQQPAITLADSSLQAERITGLSQPTAIAFLGANDLLVTEKTGNVVRVRNGTVEDPPVLELSANHADERGVLGIALHPRFGTNNWVYIYWTWTGEGTEPEGLLGNPSDNIRAVPEYGNRIDRFTWDGTRLTFDRNIIQLPSRTTDLTLDRRRGNHNGGTIKFGPDGMLYAVIGDQNARGRLQNVADGPDPAGREALQGVLLRLNDDGSIPRDNPFASAFNDERAAIFVYGIRNSFGFTFDPESDELWLESNGQASYDVLGRYEGGDNLGWIQIMGPSSRFEDYKALETDTDRKLDNPVFPPDMLADSSEEALDRLVLLPEARFREPVFAWRFAPAPTAIEFYEGDLLVGDVNTGSIYRFRLTPDRMGFDLQGRLADGVNDNTEADLIGELVDSLFAEGVPVVTDIKVGPDGTLWIASNALQSIFRVTGQ